MNCVSYSGFGANRSQSIRRRNRLDNLYSLLIRRLCRAGKLFSGLKWTAYHQRMVHNQWVLTRLFSIPDKEKKFKLIFISTLFCGASKGFMRAFKAFIKPSEAPQRSVKIKIQLNFHFNTTLRNARDVKD